MPDDVSPADTMFERLVCCVCGQDTADSDDYYVLLGISAPGDRQRAVARRPRGTSQRCPRPRLLGRGPQDVTP
ncbi:hypothetical protein ACU686_11875 [Yinghuangia aomiensis]